MFNKFSIYGHRRGDGAGGIAPPWRAGTKTKAPNRVATETDWSVFVEDDPRQCWVVSQPVETVNTRDGNEVEVNRGDILIFVSYWPEHGPDGGGVLHRRISLSRRTTW